MCYLLPAMSDIQPTKPTPQFGTAEYSIQNGGDICTVCKAPITGTYYRANGSMVCGSCADRVRRELPQDSHGSFVRALLFGFGGFAVGLALYASFVIITDISIGYISLAVGWIVGKAMMMGSKGIGGKRYQVAAVLLTYAAVSMAFIPIVLSVLHKEKVEAKNVQVQKAPAQSDAQAATTKPEAKPGDSTEQDSQPQKMGFARALGTLAFIGLASPFLELKDGFSGVIGLVILFVGMQFAWKMTAGHAQIAVDGPFQVSAA